MKTTPESNDEVEDRASHVKNICLGTPVILREILQQFSNQELIKLSLVNKQWNYKARSVLRDRGTLKAEIWSTEPCKDLETFASDLRQLHVVPFSGLSILLSHHWCWTDQPFEQLLDPLYNVILERLPFKSLKLHFRYSWDIDRDCPALELVKTVLKNCGGVLEILEIVVDGGQRILPLLLALFQNCSFPSLKTLKPFAFGDDHDFTTLVKALVTGAPNLRELHAVGNINLTEDILGGSSAVVVPSRYGMHPLYEPMCEKIAGALRAEKIVIQRRPEEDFKPELLNRLVPIMLQASRMTIKTLWMDLLFALPLMCYGICFENVTTLEIYLDDGQLERISPRISALLKGFDFTRIFPKLNKAEIQTRQLCYFSPAQIRAFIAQGKTVLKRTLPDRATNIKQLTLLTSAWDSTVPFLAQMFPDLDTLTVYKRSDDTRQMPFTSIWNYFKDLKQFKVIHTGSRRTLENLDSVFCGIFPEEVAELREKDDEYLKDVHIVPVMPSLMCMKDLKNFTFLYNPESHKPKKEDSNFIFSKVTGLVGFARCRHLVVVFETPTRLQCAEALRHMKPFASLATVDVVNDD